MLNLSPLKNRSLQVRMVKDGAPEVVAIDPAELAKVSKEVLAHAAAMGLIVYSAAKILDTACKIALIAAEHHI